MIVTVVALSVLSRFGRCLAHDGSIADSCDDLTACSTPSLDLSQSDSGSHVQIAILPHTESVVESRHAPILHEAPFLALDMSLVANRRLMPAISLMLILIFCSLLLQWYRSWECSQHSISGRADGASITSTILLLANVWPNIICAGIIFGMVDPLQPYLCLSFFARRYTILRPSEINCDETPDTDYCKKAVNDNVWWIGAMSFVSAVVHIGMGPALGTLSDAFGRKPIIVICEVLKLIPAIAFGLFVFFEVSLYPWYVLSVFKFLPVVGVWFALITDLIVAPERRAIAFGLCLLGFELSALGGMVVAAFLSVQATIALSTILHLVNLFYVVVLLRETLPADARAPVKPENLVPGVALSILTRHSFLQRLCFVFIISEFATSGLEKIGLSFFQEHLAFDKRDNYVNSILGQVSVLAWVALLMHQIVAVTGEVGLLYVAQGFGFAFSMGLYFATSPAHIFALECVVSGAVALMFPATAALKGNMVAASEQGHLQGAVQGIRSLAMSLGPLIFGCAFNFLDENPGSFCGSTGQQCARLIFAVGAILHGLTIPVIASMQHDFQEKLVLSGD